VPDKKASSDLPERASRRHRGVSNMNESAMLDADRRKFLIRASTLGAAVLFTPYRRLEAAEAPLETTKIRLVHTPSICSAPQYIAEELLRLDGFTDVQYLPLGTRNGPYALADGRADIAMWDIPGLIPHLDAGRPIVLLAGVHAGCYELFANERVNTIRDLKGKTVAIQYFGGGDQVLLSSMLAYVGINPQHDVTWVNGKGLRDAMELFVENKADALLGFAQQPEELRARKFGHVIVDTAQDRPWSQYFCCMVAANRAFAQRNPVATRRVLRAILKATDICAADPQRAARYLSDKLYEPRFQIGLNVMKRLPYNRWRESNPEDTLRFHALRLHEVGMIKSTPQQLVDQGTDWRFLDEIKKELKA
jgi:NitT/TauT family transport system substrate-binding protein